MRGREFTIRESIMLTSLYQQGLTVEQMATTLGRTNTSIRCKLWQLGLVRRHPTDDDNKYILDNYKKKTAKEIADYLNITLGCLYTRYYRLKSNPLEYPLIQQ
jgi:hypothetical protein